MTFSPIARSRRRAGACSRHRAGPRRAAGGGARRGAVRPLLLPLAALALLAGRPAPLSAQEIPRGEYLRFVPLRQPKLVAATPASREFRLYGDRSLPGYRDRDPVDGIDDERGRRLERIAARFAPFMLRNTTERPIAFERFVRRPPSFPVYVDTWDLNHPRGRLVGTETVDVSPRRSEEDARRLRELLEEFHPLRSDSRAASSAVAQPERENFKVLFFDFPGEGPASWKREYRNLVSGDLPSAYRGWERLYAHPFLREVPDPADPERRWEFVMQYYAFYPSNDGANNHEGDWQPLNVVVTLRGHERAALSRREVRGVLGRTGSTGSAGSGRDGSDEGALEELVIARVEYFFHFNTMTLDFLDPNVYQPRERWRKEIESRPVERLGERWMWKRTREMAYRSPAEREVNTHPLVYIGGDAKGLEQLLQMPGGSSRDGHASYPFPGLYKDIGPAGAAEAIHGPLRFHHAVYDSARSPDPRVVRYDDPGKLRLLPDWERVLPVAEGDPELLRRWAFHFLPIRFGYPAVESPFAGVVPHAPTGNLSTPGPSYNNKWNRVAELTGDAFYEPHKFAGTFPLGWQDAFVNSWGFLNLTLPTLTILPPLDFAWRVLAAPVRAPFQARHPTFFPRDRAPYRFVAADAGVSIAALPDNFTLLFTHPALFDQIEPFIEGTDPPARIENVDAAAAVGTRLGVEFHIGRKFTTRNSLRRVTGDLGFDLRRPEEPGAVPVRGDLEMWEYSGSLRYNLVTGQVLPFVKAGYGLSWFRLRDATLGERSLDPGGTGWLRKPSIVPPDNLFPNAWHAGVGVEFVPIRGFGSLPQGLDVSLRASYSVYAHGLGLERKEAFAEQEDFTLARGHLDLGLSLSY